MKNLIKTLAILTTVMALAGSAMAGQCCTKSAEKAKKGEACAQCTKSKCCKEAINKVGKDAKPCTACAKDAKKK